MSRIAIGNLSPGTRFTQPETGMSGVLLKANPCRAFVRIDGQSEKVVTIPAKDGNGNDRLFTDRVTRETSWSPSVMVSVVEDQ